MYNFLQDDFGDFLPFPILIPCPHKSLQQFLFYPDFSCRKILIDIKSVIMLYMHICCLNFQKIINKHIQIFLFANHINILIGETEKLFSIVDIIYWSAKVISLIVCMTGIIHDVTQEQSWGNEIFDSWDTALTHIEMQTLPIQKLEGFIIEA